MGICKWAGAVGVAVVMAVVLVQEADAFSNRQQFKTEAHFQSLHLHSLEFYPYEECPQYYKDRFAKYHGKMVDVVIQSHSILDESQSGVNARQYQEDHPDAFVMKPKEVMNSFDPTDENLLKNVSPESQEKMDAIAAEKKAEKEEKKKEDAVPPPEMELAEEKAKDDQSLKQLNKELAKDPLSGKKVNLKGAVKKAAADTQAFSGKSLGEVSMASNTLDGMAAHVHAVKDPDEERDVVPAVKKVVTKEGEDAKVVARAAQGAAQADKARTGGATELPLDQKAPTDGADDVTPEAGSMGLDDDTEPVPKEKVVRAPTVPKFIAPTVSDAVNAAVPPPESAHTCRAATALKDQHRKQVRASTGFREKMEVQCVWNKDTQKVAGVALVVPVSKNLPTVQTTLFEELGTIDWDYGFVATQEIRCSGEYICLNDFYKEKELKSEEDHHAVDPTFNMMTEAGDGAFCIANVRTDNQEIRRLYHVIPNHMDNRKVVFGADADAVDAEHI